MECIISCEHASNRVPGQYAYLFRDRENLLASHQAYDPGSAKFARRLAGELQVPVFLGKVSRLLIDLNRSQSNRKTLFSRYSKGLGKNDRARLLKEYYEPYRISVDKTLGRIIDAGKPVVHISIHSFTPVRKGQVRKADIGLLYDPARVAEKNICGFLTDLLKREIVSLQVRRNYPYLGKTDGFTSFLRRRYPANFYAGIEIELNQSLLLKKDLKKKKMIQVVAEGIKEILKEADFNRLKN